MKDRVTVSKRLIETAQALLDRLKTRGWDDNAKALAHNLQYELYEKYEADKRRRLYSTSKDPELYSETREIARQMYLDSVGMRESFRWDEGENPHLPPS